MGQTVRMGGPASVCSFDSFSESIHPTLPRRQIRRQLQSPALVLDARPWVIIQPAVKQVLCVKIYHIINKYHPERGLLSALLDALLGAILLQKELRRQGHEMSFCFGFISNDAEKMGCALSPFRFELVVPEGAPHGWGLAYYQVGQPLLKKQPKPMTEELDFTRAMDNLRSNVVLGHVRNATVGGQRTDNTHPFRLRTWTFCHCGTVERFEQIKNDILRSIPDFIRRNIRGKTDSEHIFHLFLSFLNDTGRLDDHRMSPEVAARALGSTFTYLDRLVVDNGGHASASLCLATDGSFLIGYKRGIELAASRHGTYSCPDSHGKIVPAPQLRAVVLLGGRSPSSPGWEPVTDRSIVIVDSQLDIRTFTPDSST